MVGVEWWGEGEKAACIGEEAGNYREQDRSSSDTGNLHITREAMSKSQSEFEATCRGASAAPDSNDGLDSEEAACHHQPK